MDEGIIEDIHEIAENSAYLKAIEEREISTEMWDTLPPYEACADLERQLERDGKLNFDDIFTEPQGFYMIKSFLISDYAGDKAIFIKDVQNYKKMRFESARRRIAKLIYRRYVAPQDENTPPEFKKFISVFDLMKDKRFFLEEERSVVRSRSEAPDEDGGVMAASMASMASFGSTGSMMGSFALDGPMTRHSLAFGSAAMPDFDDQNDPYEAHQSMPPSMSALSPSGGLMSSPRRPASSMSGASAGSASARGDSRAVTPKPGKARRQSIDSEAPDGPMEISSDNSRLQVPGASKSKSMLSMGDNNNSIGVYGRHVAFVREHVERDEAPANLFDDIARNVLADLKMDMFPRFLKSDFFRKYIRTKSVETMKVDFKRDFVMFRPLGRGGFGSVHACRKKNSGTIYAVKCISKKLVKVKKALDNVLEERNVLAKMNSVFVTNLKYALQDEDNLYLIMDLMLGGDLKFHLINAGRFTEKRARFYAAQVLLGLEHVHQQGIIYRDMKLENVLLDHLGNCKLSDLGLAVMTKDKIKGYAGTPGYTAPEMIQNKFYGPAADIFSYGVMLYRMLCGAKPFKGKVDRELDKAVLSRKPAFAKEIFTRDAMSLLTGLMEKTPEKRLGCQERGTEEIKEHPFFREIDWGLLEAGYIEPSFVPNRFDVNAASLKDIGDFDKNKYRNIKLDERFKYRTKDFEYISVKALGEEMAAVLSKVDENTNFEKFSNTKKSGAATEPLKKQAGCCVLS